VGLKELKQLVYIILEVSKANNISPDRAVLKFLDDIEKDYDNKLGFETKLKEKQDELAFLNNKVNNCRTILQSQSSIGGALSNLLQKGITESDIININQLVEVVQKVIILILVILKLVIKMKTLLLNIGGILMIAKLNQNTGRYG
jgi:hypothetical protein